MFINFLIFFYLRKSLGFLSLLLLLFSLSIGVTDVTYYRWRSEFGGLKTDQVKRMKDLELENQRLRKAVSDLTLDKLILSEAAKGNF